MENADAEASKENKPENSESFRLDVVINGVLERFTSRAEYRKWLEEQLNEQA